MAIDVVVADDLTGAADTVAQFLPIAEQVLVFPELHQFKRVVDTGRLPAGDLAIGVSTESRHVGPAQAALRVRLAHRIALRLRPRLLFQKVDSALRGNPGAELDAYRSTTGAPTVLMTPAFPPSRRSVRQGVLYVDGVPLAESAVGRDLRTPASESFVPTVLSRQTELSVGELPLGLVRSRSNELVSGLRTMKPGIVVADAEWSADLAGIARAVADAGLLHAVSGSAGLARELGLLLGQGKTLPPGAIAAMDRRVLAVIGSPHPVARAQIQRSGGRIVALPSEPAGKPHHEARWKVIERLAEALTKDHLAILRPPPLEDDTPTGEAADAMSAALAGIARDLISCPAAGSDGRVQAIVVSGGDVAAAVCKQFGTDYIELLDQVFPGAPLGVLRGGLGDGLPIVTKSGAHGDQDGLLRIVARLRDGADRAVLRQPAERPGGVSHD